MTSFATSTIINASQDAVWRILTDASGYPEWNSTVARVNGTIALGQQVTVHTKHTPDRAFPVKVAELDEPRRMVWRGGMPLGLFRGERTFTLSPAAGGAVEFSMREHFSGLLAPIICKSIPNLQPAFDEFAACLKARAEGHAP